MKKNLFYIMYFILGIIFYYFFVLNLNKEINEYNGECFYGKNIKTGFCNNINELEEKNIEYSKFGYIEKNNKLIISDRFNLFKKRNLFTLGEKKLNVSIIETKNISIFYLFGIIKNLNLTKINNINLFCVDLNNDSIKNLEKIINFTNIKSINIDNILCGENFNNLNSIILEKIFNLKINNLVLNIGGSYINNLEEYIKSTNIDNITIGTCYKKGNNIKIENNCGF